MDRNFLKKVCLSVGILIFLVAMFANPATAGRVVRPYHPVNLLITAVFVDFENSTITIKGHHFERGYDPIVHLGDANLRVQSFTNREIVTDLPGEISDGDYLLTVVTGPSSNHYDSYALTLMSGGLETRQSVTGPAGPQGPMGPQGPAGPAGPTGPMGPTGSQGGQGPAGSAGPMGPMGPQGPAGQQGQAGVQGPPGGQGLQGPQGSPGISGYEKKSSRPGTYGLASGAIYVLAIDCTAGKSVLGGGAYIHTTARPQMVYSGPTATGWVVKWFNPGEGTLSVDAEVYAICADIQ
jgi:hypothetical protein